VQLGAAAVTVALAVLPTPARLVPVTVYIVVSAAAKVSVQVLVVFPKFRQSKYSYPPPGYSWPSESTCHPVQ
jgi:hypothetical protein